MHHIQDLFLESFSYVLQFDMHFYMHSYVDKIFILIKSGCYRNLPKFIQLRSISKSRFSRIKTNSDVTPPNNLDIVTFEFLLT
jgi:hypothetical protein